MKKIVKVKDIIFDKICSLTTYQEQCWTCCYAVIVAFRKESTTWLSEIPV